MTSVSIPQPPQRTVKPRRRTFKAVPVVAIHGTSALCESGEVVTLTGLIQHLPEWPSTIFAVLGAADFLAELEKVYASEYPDTWQWEASAHERSFVKPTHNMRAVKITAMSRMFGWKGHSFHRAIDPVVMHGHRLETMFPGDFDPLVRLLKWGVAIRDFCAENGYQVRPTTGAIMAQSLTDPRFYAKPRSKVHTKINERAHENLPGNHYHLNIEPSSTAYHDAIYLDQHRSHHYHARTTVLPDSNHCYAYGAFVDLRDIAFTETNPLFHGLYCLDLCAPTHRPSFDWIGDRLNEVFVFSNEVPHLRDNGYSVTGVRAAWGSLHCDTGLPRYAEWATAQLDSHEDSPWLKQLLLTTYGVLAVRPKQREAIFRIAKAGTEVTIPTGRHTLTGKFNRSKHKLQPGIAHALQRGMIEAACRSESIGCAQWLEHLGRRVLSIYADAVLVESDEDNPLPPLPEPWRCKRTLHNLRFINQQAFQSDGMTKLPGVAGRDLNEFRQHAPGYAPRRVQYEAVTGRKIQTNRRI